MKAAKRKKKSSFRERLFALKTSFKWVSLGVLLCAIVLIFSNIELIKNKVNQKFSNILIKSGFVVRTIQLHHHKHTSSVDLLHALQLKKGSYLWNARLKDARARIEALAWVKKASLVRSLTGRMDIYIEEREPIAIFHDNQQATFVLIDSAGERIQCPIEACFKGLPVVSGKNSAHRAPAFLQQLSSFPIIKSQVSALVLIQERRWNIKLQNKIEIKLPELDVTKALTILNVLMAQEKISNSDILSVDLRFSNKIILKLSKSGQELIKILKASKENPVL